MQSDNRQQQTQQNQQNQQQGQQNQSASPARTSANQATRDTGQAIPTTTEPARRPAMFNRGRLLTPWELMRRMNQELDRLVEVVQTQQTGGTAVTRANPSQGVTSDVRSADDVLSADWIPRVEVAHRDGAMVVRAELPGLKPDDIVVNIEQGMVSISGERKQEQHEERGGVIRTERAYGTFFRAIPLPDGADEEHITATFRDGVLELTVPVAERERGRRVAVQS